MQVRASLQARTPSGVRAESKLALLEFLLGSEDITSCAQRGIEWLCEHTRIRQAVCLAIDINSKYLQPVAGQGVAPDRLAEFTLDIEDHTHPLVDVLSRSEPMFFVRGPQQPRSPLDGASFHAIPLRSHREQYASGLLLVSTAEARLDPVIRWAAEVMGEKLTRLRAIAASGRLGRERSYLYNIINAVTDPIMLTDPEGKLLIANSRAEKLFSAPDEASEGWRRAVGLNNMLFSAALASWAVAATGTARRELTLVDPIEGSDLLFELLSSPAKDPGEGTVIVSVLRNVTDLGRAMAEIEESYRKLRDAEAEIRAERNRLDLIIDSVADPIVVTSPEGVILLMNTPAERFFVSRATAGDEGQRRMRTNEAHFTSFVSNLLFVSDAERYTGEITLVDPVSGVPMPAEAIAGKILSEQGELTAVVTILHDRTEAIEKAQLFEQVKKASRELEVKVQEATASLAQQNELLRRQALELEQASALKSQFLANVSHEFRTPLNAILGYTYMLLQGVHGQLMPQQKKGLGRVDSNARHLLALINDILDITRIEAGRMPLHVDSFDLHDLFREVLAELEPLIARSRLPVNTVLPRAVPRIRSDRQKVKQILLNLLSNALKFTQTGSVKIRASLDKTTETIRINVEDTGMGIPETDRDKVFEDFRQLDNSPTRAHGGTGLGLSICRRLAGMLEGRITLQSKVGQGSTFTLHLPLRARRTSRKG